MQPYPVLPLFHLLSNKRWLRTVGAFATVPLLALSIGYLAAACSSPPPPPDQRKTRRSEPQVRVLSWERYQVGSEKGYIRSIAGPGGPIHEVYDEEMRIVGYYTAMGSTYGVARDGEQKLLGQYDANDSLRAIHGIDSLQVEVKRMPMEEPLTLEKLEEKVQGDQPEDQEGDDS